MSDDEGSDYSDYNNEVGETEYILNPNKTVKFKSPQIINIKDDDDEFASVSDDNDNDDEYQIEDIIDNTLNNKKTFIEEEDDEDDNENDFSDEEYVDNNDTIYNNPKTTTTINPKKTNITKKTIKKTNFNYNDNDEDDDLEENYLQKFETEIISDYITEFHPECYNHNADEINKLSVVIRDSNNFIIDSLHKTTPILTKYEKTRILGQRSKQIEGGSKPFVLVPENIIDSYIIANLELQEKKIPFIIKRPIPNGKFEYWKVKDLEILY